MIGIYKITNKVNGKCYIGQSVNIKKRFKEHRCCKQNRPLYNAFKKYGIENFDFDVICECKIEELDELEKKFIKQYKSNIYGFGYNLSFGGTNISLRQITLKKMPELKKKEWYKKVSQKEKGKIITQEQRKKISKTLKEYFKDENNRKKLSEQRKGKPLSKETIEKIKVIQKENMKLYSKRVLQYSLSGVFIMGYDSIQEASFKNNIHSGNIASCCNGKRHTASGFKWKYDEEFNQKYRKKTNRIIKPKPPLKGQPPNVPKRWKKVYQYDDNYNLIKIFESFKSIENEFKSYKNISACCRGLREHAYGYRWSYEPINKNVIMFKKCKLIIKGVK